MKQKKKYATLLGELIKRYEAATNPVTRSSYREIIAHRIGIKEFTVDVRQN